MDNDKTILLVEDNPDDVELTRQVFTKFKLANRIVEAHDGVEALDYLFGTGAHAGRDISKAPQLILLDIKLPKIKCVRWPVECMFACAMSHDRLLGS
jgi:two-component system response regulator